MEVSRSSGRVSDYNSGVIRDENVERNEDGVDCKHKVFLSHSGEQKDFVQWMCDEIERHDRSAFFDKNRDCLPLGCDFPREIFKAIEECEVGVVVLSEAFFTKTTWPMEEFARLAKRKEENKDFIIILVLYDIELAECRTVEKQEEWKRQWQEWARTNKLIVMEDWTAVFRLFGPILSISRDNAGGAKRVISEVVAEICKLVTPGTRLDDPDMEGRDRICKLVLEKRRASHVSREDGARVVGLYGVGGIGKSTLCKALCQKLRSEFGGRVCHAELATNSDGEGKENELLGEVMKRLILTPPEVVAGYNKSERWNLLMHKLRNQKVFLAIDNVGDGARTRKQAKSLLRAKFAKGSFVVVTARTIEMLGHVGVNERECHEMPELEYEEAKCLFMNNVPKALGPDDALVKEYVGMCHFSKGVGDKYHYHPLALKVLGGQLGSNPKERLRGQDPFNASKERDHPIFSILRSSYDLLESKDQLLFMDLALFFPERRGLFHDISYKAMNIITWLCVIHGRSEEDMMSQLQLLKQKSLIECIGDGTGVVGMHDLWREFCITETRKGDCRGQLFHRVGEIHESFVEGKFLCGGWENLQRVCLTASWNMWNGIKVKRVNLKHCLNLTVLKLVNVEVKNGLVDVSPLLQLKSLEVLMPFRIVIDLQGLGVLENLCVLMWSGIPSDLTSIGEIASLINLEVLVLRWWPQMDGDLVPIRYLGFSDLRCLLLSTSNSDRLLRHPVWSSMVNLQCLRLRSHEGMHSCNGLEDLVALVELDLGGCSKLEVLSCLKKLTRLEKLDISQCRVAEVLGLECLVALQEFRADWCPRLTQLPNMQWLSKLKILSLNGSLVKPIMGLEKLTALQVLRVHFDTVERCPSQAQLTMMQGMEVASWGEQGLPCMVGWTGLEVLSISGCHGVWKLEGLESLSSLQCLKIKECGFGDVSIVSCLTSLQDLSIWRCKRLENVPCLDQLLKLQTLLLYEVGATMWETCGTLPQLQRLIVQGVPIHCLPNLGNFPQLSRLQLSRCHSLIDVTTDGPLAMLKSLYLSNCSSLESLPSLWGCAKLVGVFISGCQSLRSMTDIRASKILWDCKISSKEVRVDKGEYQWRE